MKRPRVLLADDHAIVIEGLRRVLEPGFEIVGEAADGRVLVAAAEKLRPDIIVADISMPLLNGIEAARQIRKIDRKVKIIFLTMHPDVTYAAEALRAGGSAYVLKSSAGAETRGGDSRSAQRTDIRDAADRQRGGAGADGTGRPRGRASIRISRRASGKCSS